MESIIMVIAIFLMIYNGVLIVGNIVYKNHVSGVSILMFSISTTTIISHCIRLW